MKRRFRADNGEALRNACAQGIEITINSRWIAYELLRESKLVQILKGYPLVSDSAIWAVYPISRQLAPKVRAFIDYFAGIYGDMPFGIYRFSFFHSNGRFSLIAEP